MNTPTPITEADVIRTAKECSDAIMKRYAKCADAMLGIADPAALRADLEALLSAVGRITGAGEGVCTVPGEVGELYLKVKAHMPAESVEWDGE